MKRLHIIYIIALVLSMTSCIEPPLHLPGQDLEVIPPQVETDLTIIWDHEVDLQNDWYYGWDLQDDSIWGSIGYPTPTRYEVRRYFKGDDMFAKHDNVDAFTTNTTRFRRYFQFGYYDMLFYSDIDSKDGTQVLVMNETLDSITATTTGTRGISRSILDMSRSNSNDSTGAIGLLNQPEIFYGAYPENIYISHDLSDYEYDPVENIYIKHLEAKLRPLVYIYLVQFILLNNDDGRIKGINGNAAISSMAASVLPPAACCSIADCPAAITSPSSAVSLVIRACSLSSRRFLTRSIRSLKSSLSPLCRLTVVTSLSVTVLCSACLSIASCPALSSLLAS